MARVGFVKEFRRRTGRGVNIPLIEQMENMWKLYIYQGKFEKFRKHEILKFKKFKI